MIIWLTGQPGAGKTTLARALERRIPGQVFTIDGDDLRSLSSNKDYSFVGRANNVARAQRIARYLDAREGSTVIVSLVSPYLEQREELKESNRVLEVHVHTTAVRGKERYFVEGYEPPRNNYIEINTTNNSIEECTDEILNVYRKMAAVA